MEFGWLTHEKRFAFLSLASSVTVKYKRKIQELLKMVVRVILLFEMRPLPAAVGWSFGIRHFEAVRFFLIFVLSQRTARWLITAIYCRHKSPFFVMFGLQVLVVSPAFPKPPGSPLGNSSRDPTRREGSRRQQWKRNGRVAEERRRGRKARTRVLCATTVDGDWRSPVERARRTLFGSFEVGTCFRLIANDDDDDDDDGPLWSFLLVSAYPSQFSQAAHMRSRMHTHIHAGAHMSARVCIACGGGECTHCVTGHVDIESGGKGYRKQWGIAITREKSLFD